MQDKNKTYEFLIVGSGAGGATLARESAAGAKRCSSSSGASPRARSAPSAMRSATMTPTRSRASPPPRRRVSSSGAPLWRAEAPWSPAATPRPAWKRSCPVGTASGGRDRRGQARDRRHRHPRHAALEGSSRSARPRSRSAIGWSPCPSYGCGQVPPLRTMRARLRPRRQMDGAELFAGSPEAGAEIAYGLQVQQVLIEQGRARGVRVRQGRVERELRAAPSSSRQAAGDAGHPTAVGDTRGGRQSLCGPLCQYLWPGSRAQPAARADDGARGHRVSRERGLYHLALCQPRAPRPFQRAGRARDDAA